MPRSMLALLPRLTLLLGLFTAAVPWSLAQEGTAWEDASGVLSVVSQSPRYFDRVNRRFFSDVTLENTSGGEIEGVFRLVVPTSSIDVKDAAEFTGAGEPSFPIFGNRFAPGEQLTVRVTFERQRGVLSYSVRPEWLPSTPGGDEDDFPDPPVENNPPSISGAGPLEVQVGQFFEFTPTAIDFDGDPLSFSVNSRQPPWTDFDPATGRLYGTPTQDDVQTWGDIKISVSDGEATTHLNLFRIQVKNTAPDIDGEPPLSVGIGETYSFTPSADDINGDALTFQIENQPAWASFDPATGRLSGTPGLDDVGVAHHVNIAVTDGRATTEIGRFNIHVENRAPLISGTGALETNQGALYSFTPAASDPDGHPLSFEFRNLPAWLSGDPATGTVSGTPTLQDVGIYYDLRVGANDGYATTWSENWRVTVRNAPAELGGTPPATVDSGHPYSFTPDATDPDGNPLTFSLRNAPAWLSVDVATGRLSGTPTRDDLGSHPGIDLCATDGISSGCLGAFTIDVLNQAPVIESTPPTIAEVGVRYTYTAVATDNNGDVLQFLYGDIPAWIDTFNPSTGTVSGVPTERDIGTSRDFRIGVTDFIAGVEQRFDIEVVPGASANTPPVIGGTPPATVDSGKPYSFMPSASDPDADPLTFALRNAPDWLGVDGTTGALTGAPIQEDLGLYEGIDLCVDDGEETRCLGAFSIEVLNQGPEFESAPPTVAEVGLRYSYTPTVFENNGDALLFISGDLPPWIDLFDPLTGTISGIPEADDLATWPGVRITVTDSLISEEQRFDIEVIPAGVPDNTPPTIGGSPEVLADVGAPYSFTPVAADADGDLLTFAVENPPAWALFDPATGSLSGTPGAIDADSLAEDIRISVSDGTDQASLAPFSIQVSNLNRAPTIEGTPDTLVIAGDPYGFEPIAADEDGDPLTFEIDNAPAWASFDSDTGRLSGTPALSDEGLYEGIVIRVHDGTVSEALPTFAILVDLPAAVNEPPLIGGDPITEGRPGFAYSFTPDASDPDGDPLTFTIQNKPGWAVFDPATGTLSGTPTGRVGNNFANIVIGVEDAEFSTALPAFTITLVSNQAPVFEGALPERVQVGQEYRFTPDAAYDPDGDPLSFEMTRGDRGNLPHWLTIDQTTGVVSGVPDRAALAEQPYWYFTLHASDGNSRTTLAWIHLRVDNTAPTISGEPATLLGPAGAYEFVPSATDANNDALTFKIENKPAWADFDPATGRLAGTPGLADVGDYNAIRIGVSDGSKTVWLPRWGIRVSNQAPVFEGVLPDLVEVGHEYRFTPAAAYDPDGHALTFEMTAYNGNLPAWLTLDQATGALVGTPDQAAVGQSPHYHFNLHASDGFVRTSLQRVTLQVVNSRPEISGDINQAINIGDAYSFTPTATDSNGDALSFSVEGLPAWASFDATTGTISGTPGLGDVGNYKRIRVGANDGLTTSWSPNWRVDVRNRAPVFQGMLPERVQVGQEYRFTPDAAYDPDGHPLTFSMTAHQGNLPAWLTLDQATGSLVGTPDRAALAAQPYWYFTLEARDGYATTRLPEKHLRVENTAPTIEGEPPRKVDVGQSYAFTPEAGDINGDSLSFTIDNKPAWASFDPATGSLTGDPANDDIRNWGNIRIGVTDGVRTTYLPRFDILVDLANSPPIITGNPPLMVAPGRTYSFTPAARDVDADDVLTFSVQNLPPWASFDEDTGTLTGTPGVGDADSLTPGVIVSVDDGDYTVGLDPFDIEVAAAPFDEVEAALASGDALFVTDADDLLDAAIAAAHATGEREIETMLRGFRDQSFNFDWTDCSDSDCMEVEGFGSKFRDGARLVQQRLRAMDRTKLDLFNAPDADLRLDKLLVLLGDLWRQQARFPMDRNATATMAFLRSYLADHALYLSREWTWSQPDMGNFSHSDFRAVVPEVVDVDLVSRKRFRAAGVYALPGETFTVTRLDDSPVGTKIFINTLRDSATQEWSNNGYNRPKFLQSTRFELMPGETLVLSSPYGGTVQVEFNDNDHPVSLRFEHVGRHPVWRGPEDTAGFLAAVEAHTYNWVEFITPAFELHSRWDWFQSTLQGWPDLVELQQTIDRYTFDLPLALAGYEGEHITPIPEVERIAAANGWNFKRNDIVWRMNADQPTCGAGCSGNPWDANWAFSPLFHGDLHEFGHSLQGRLRFTGWPNHAMTNYYSYYAKSRYYEDTGELGTSKNNSCQRREFQQLFEIVQASMAEPNPGAYVRVQLNNTGSGEVAPDDDYPELYGVADGMGITVFLQFMMLAETHGALENGWHLRTLMHLHEHNYSEATRNETDWLARRDSLGMGDYSLAEAKAISPDDLQLIAMSYSTGLDYRAPYDMLGILTSAKAQAQIAALNLPPLPREVFVSAPSDYCTGLDKPALPADGTQVWPLGSGTTSTAADEPQAVFGSLGNSMQLLMQGGMHGDGTHVCTGPHEDGTDDVSRESPLH
jgi:hypothetical protein